MFFSEHKSAGRCRSGSMGLMRLSWLYGKQVNIKMYPDMDTFLIKETTPFYSFKHNTIYLHVYPYCFTLHNVLLYL